MWKSHTGVSVATDPDAKKSGSLAVFDHEFAHAYDWAMGKISRSPAFEAAFKADFTALYNASPKYWWYFRALPREVQPLKH